MKGCVEMEMAKVTSKGQITIPVSIRRRLDIKEGDKLLFIDSPDGVIMVNPDLLQGNQDIESHELGAESQKAPKTRTEAAPAPELEKSAVTEKQFSVSNTDSVSRTGPAAPAEKEPDKPGTQSSQVKGVDIAALLDEIRSIGSKI